MLAYTIAILAPISNCIQLLPQLYKTYHTKHVEDLSPKSLCLILLTSILWLSHGYFIQDISLIVAGIITVLVNTTLITLFFKYRQNNLNYLESS